jgi:hypothetical protein
VLRVSRPNDDAHVVVPAPNAPATVDALVLGDVRGVRTKAPPQRKVHAGRRAYVQHEGGQAVFRVRARHAAWATPIHDVERDGITGLVDREADGAVDEPEVASRAAERLADGRGVRRHEVDDLVGSERARLRRVQ